MRGIPLFAGLTFAFAAPVMAEDYASPDHRAAADAAAATALDTPDEPPERDTKFGLCLLEVDGKTFISGPCSYSIWGPGHFMFNGLRQADGAADYQDPASLPTLFTEKFVYVFNYEDDIDQGTGQSWYASWNEEPNSSKADAYLGPVKRDGPCLTNERTKICLWES